MITITKESTDEFLNALQLSVDCKIKSGRSENKQIYVMFEENAQNDRHCQFFQNLTHGEWSKDGKTLKFSITDTHSLKMLWTLLMMTRLEEENMRGLAKIDKDFAWLNNLLDSKPNAKTTVIHNVKRASEFIFGEIQDKKMTLREFSELTGLTQVTLSRFKQGQDVRLSNFLQMTKALGIEIILNSKITG